MRPRLCTGGSLLDAGVQPEAEARAEADGAQHAQRVCARHTGSLYLSPDAAHVTQSSSSISMATAICAVYRHCSINSMRKHAFYA